MCHGLHATAGQSCPQSPQNFGEFSDNQAASEGYLLSYAEIAPRKAFLDGNFAGRRLEAEPSEYEIWDTLLVGFGLRVQPNGQRAGFVRVRHRGRHRRITLGCSTGEDALTVRRQGW